MTGRTILEGRQNEIGATRTGNSFVIRHSPKEDDKRKESLLRKSQGRLCLQRKYNPSFGSRRNKNFENPKHLQMNKNTTDDSTMTTWSESTEVSQTQQGYPDNVQQSPSFESCQPNVMEQNHDDSWNDNVNIIHDKYVVLRNETNDTIANISHPNSERNAFCGISACDGGSFGCYRTICNTIEEFRGQQKQQQQQDLHHPEEDREGNDPTIGSIYPKQNEDKKEALGNVKPNEWDFAIESVGEPIEKIRASRAITYERNSLNNMLVGCVPDTGTIPEKIKHANIPWIGRKAIERNWVMSSTSIVLRKRFGLNMTLQTRRIMLRRALLTRRWNARFVTPKTIINNKTDLMAPSRTRLLQMQKALYQRKKEASLMAARILGGFNSVAMEPALSNRVLCGLLLMHTMALINEIDKKSSPRVKQHCREQQIRSNGLLLDSTRSIQTIPSTDSSTGETQIDYTHKDELLLLGFVPPGYIYNFEHALDETTDLSAAYISAHNNSKRSVAHDLDDESVEEELANLESIEHNLRHDLELSVKSWANTNEELGQDSDEPLNSYPSTDAVTSVLNAILAISCDFSSSQDDGSLDKTESSFNVQDARRAVVSVVQRLKSQIPMNRQSLLENLERIQERMLDDLIEISRGSRTPAAPYPTSDDHDVEKWVEVRPSGSSISDVTMARTNESQEDLKKTLEHRKSIAALSNPSEENKVIPFSGENHRTRGSPKLFDFSTSTKLNSVYASDKDRYICSFRSTHERFHQNFSNNCDNVNPRILQWRKRRSIWGSLLAPTKYKGNHRSVLAGFLRKKERRQSFKSQNLVPGSTDEPCRNNDIELLRSSNTQTTCSMEDIGRTQKITGGENSTWSVAPVNNSLPLASTPFNDDTIAASSECSHRPIGGDLADSGNSMYWQSFLKNHNTCSTSNEVMDLTKLVWSDIEVPSGSLAGFELEHPKQNSPSKRSSLCDRLDTTKGMVDLYDNINGMGINEENFREIYLDGEMGFEAFLLHDEGGMSTSISDISGSTDVEYTDSESTLTSTESSSLEGIGFADTSGSESRSVPLSVVQIGLKTVASTTVASTTVASTTEEDVRYPFEQACDRKDSSRCESCETTVNQGLLERIFYIGTVVLNAWKCVPTADIPPEQAPLQIEEELLQRLQGIKHY
jgi:hypothetical protein